MKVRFLGSKESDVNKVLKLNNVYEASESIYSDYFDLKEVSGWYFLKNIFEVII